MISGGTQTMLSFFPSIVLLGAAALISLRLTQTRFSPAERDLERRAAARVLALAAAIQAAHFAEEAFTGFHHRLGDLFGLPAMSFRAFLAFNLIWLVIWVASVPGLRAGRPFAFFTAWFLAIAGMFNGLAHPLLASAANGYFPGLASSVFIATASIWLWNQLKRATQPLGAAGI